MSKTFEIIKANSTALKRSFLVVAFLVLIVTLYMLKLPAITMTGEVNCGVLEHTHTDECYEKVYTCDTEVASATEGSSAVTDVADSTNNTVLLDNTSSIENEECYKLVLKCESEEHTHIDACYVDNEKTDLITTMNSLINEIPTYDEYLIQLEVMQVNGKSSAEYSKNVLDKVESVYEQYNTLNDLLKGKIIGIEKIEKYYDMNAMVDASSEFGEVVEAVNPGAGEYTFAIKYQNNYNFTIQGGNGTAFAYNNTSRAVSLGDLLHTNSLFYPFRIIIASKNNNDIFTVTTINSNTGTSRQDLMIPAGSMAFLVSNDDGVGATSNASAIRNIAVGDFAVVAFNSNNINSQAISDNGVGIIKFYTGATPGEVKNKVTSSALSTIETVDSREYIEVNLYDYGTNINDMYNKDKSYPGFQQPGGTTPDVAHDLTDWDNYNYGDTIATDIIGKVNVNGTGTGINDLVTGYAANRPVSGTIHPTLVNNYPALSGGTKSLQYLFSNNTYTTKVNKQSINGLFKHDDVTGTYSYNSRENHAQYNSSNDTFTVYNQKITSNYIQYPFGNFFPFNDITTQTTKASIANQEYINDVINWAVYKSNKVTDTTLRNSYIQLYRSLMLFDKAVRLKNGSYDATYSGAELSRTFLDEMNIPSNTSNNTAALNTILNDIYTIDFDEKTNFFFGLEMKMYFMQPENGLTGKDGKTPMEFNFTGDDDVWVYIDNALFLDLSGIHRHVGGKIDFQNGIVYYYGLDKNTGDVSVSSYASYTFEQLLRNAGKTNAEIADLLKKNAAGKYTTFKDFSDHTFNFYYMERGSGSGVMRMNFNMPLHRKNSLSVLKEISTDTEVSLLGDPDFSFQVFNTSDDDGDGKDDLLVTQGMTYDIYDKAGNLIKTGAVAGVDGIFTIKADQKAVFSFDTDMGEYYVRELLNEKWVAQYDKVTVDGNITGTDEFTLVEGELDRFRGVISSAENVANGNTTFDFVNNIVTNKLGKIQISKKLVGAGSLMSNEYAFKVVFDGTPLTTNVGYQVCDITRSEDGSYIVDTTTCSNRHTTSYTDTNGSTFGVVKIKADQVAILNNVIAGSQFNISEVATSSRGFNVSYEGNDVVINEAGVSGVVNIEHNIKIDVTNSELGEQVVIPVEKILEHYVADQYDFTFKLYDINGATPKEIDSITVKFDDINVNTKTASFKPITYSQPQHTAASTIYKYKVVEAVPENDDPNIAYDRSEFEVVVDITNDNNGFKANMLIYKNGQAVEKVSFTNTLLSQLAIKKLVRNEDGSTNGIFNFQINIDGGANKTYETNYGTLVFDASGNATFALKHRESLIIYGLSPGTKYSVEETSKGYATLYSINDGEELEGQYVYEQSLAEGNNEVQFINMKGAKLPATGSGGRLIIEIIGLLLVVIPVIYIGYSFNKNERSVT